MSEASKRKTPSHDETASSPDEPRYRVLVVEDDPDLSESFAKWVGQAGHEAQAVASGEAAVEVLKAWVPDLVMLDLGLAEAMDGFDVLRVVRERHPQARVVIITARSADESQVQGLDLGADDYILKATPQRILMARLNAQLRRVPPRAARYRVRGVYIDLDKLQLISGDVEYALSPLEGRVLRLMIEAPRGTLSYRTLLVQAWDWPEAPRLRVDLAESPVDSLQKRLNRKFGSPVLRTVSTDTDMLLVLEAEVTLVPDSEEPPSVSRVVRPGSAPRAQR